MSHDDRPVEPGAEDVATLLRMAGRRPPVPVERLERARAAAHAAFQAQAQKRSRKRIAVVGAALAAAAASIVTVLLVRNDAPGRRPVPPAGGGIVIETVHGQVRVREGTAPPRALSSGDRLALGGVLTTASDARVALRLGSGHSVRLDRATTLHLLDSDVLALDSGAVYVDSGGGSALAVRLSVRTPLCTVEEAGTQFEVRLRDDAVQVRLRESKVFVKRESRVDEVEAGFELTLAADGSTASRAIPTHGADWEWAAAIAPPIAIENRTARAFLEWAARERGLRLAFADEAVARSADDTRLAGTIERMTPDEALAAVLPSCRMTHRVDGDVLVVAAAPRE